MIERQIMAQTVQDGRAQLNIDPTTQLVCYLFQLVTNLIKSAAVMRDHGQRIILIGYGAFCRHYPWPASSLVNAAVKMDVANTPLTSLAQDN